MIKYIHSIFFLNKGINAYNCTKCFCDIVGPGIVFPISGI